MKNEKCLWRQQILHYSLFTFHFISYLCAMKTYFALVLLLVSSSLFGGNHIYTPRIQTVTSMVNGDWMNRPVMVLGSSDVLDIGFDELSHNYHRLVYRLEHCEADWSTSDDLFESEWLSGFNGNPIDDYQNSINTTVLYTHYRLTIPNDQCSLRKSGNYRLTVYDEDNDDERLLDVEFYVVEPLVSIGMEVTTNTDIDHNDSHQQLSMTVNYNTLRVTDIDSQLHTVVMQNWQEDKARVNVRPNTITNKGLGWQHNRALIFPAGNEFHKFEVLDVSHPTMGIERIEWDGQRYQAYPFTATARKNYLTDVDANGAFCIRNSDRTEIDYTCDYVWVNYTLQAPYCGDLYINGLWTTSTVQQTYKMAYDDEQHIYRASVMQKQGYYSYQFLLADDGSLSPTEGNYYQTENNYQVLVYYKGIGERTWRLVGYRGAEFR